MAVGAARSVSPTIVAMLIESGSDVSALSRWNMTPLHIAVSNPYCDVNTVDMLINAGSDVTVQRCRRQNPVTYASPSQTFEFGCHDVFIGERRGSLSC